MPSDLHHRPVARRSLFAALVLAIVSLARLDHRAHAEDVGPSSEDAGMPVGPTPCRIDGRAAIAELQVIRRSPQGHDVVSRMDLPPREIRVHVITPSLFRVATRVGEPVIEGHTDVRPPLSLRRDVVLGGVTARRGAAILRTTPREQSLDVDIDLGAGAVLRRLVISCDALRVRAADGLEETAPPSLHRPHWRARASEIALRERGEEGIEVARVRLPSTVVLEEVRRNEAFVQVRAHLPYGRIDGWVRDNAITHVEHGAR